MRPGEKQELKIICDIGILLTALSAGIILRILSGGILGWVFLGAGILCAAASGFDLARRTRGKKPSAGAIEPEDFPIRELVLLDEKDKPLKAWNLSGRTALIIGRKNQEEEVDIDLGDCEYSALIEPQHAVLNFSEERWYLEDISQENGVRIRKAEDGVNYRLTGRPCRVGAGDVIYIANTKLLLT